MRISPLLLIPALVLLLSGCGASLTRQPADADNLPRPAHNDWAEVTRAGTGFAEEPDEQFDLPYWWEFSLKVKKGDLKSVSIYEFSTTPPQLVLSDTEVILVDGTWSARTVPVKFSRESAPWFYLPGATEHQFKFVLVDNRREERTLYQPCRHSEEAKKAQILEVIRLTAPDIRFKSHRVAPTKRHHSEFKTILPKKKQDDEVKWGFGHMGPQPIVIITNSPKRSYRDAPGE